MMLEGNPAKAEPLALRLKFPAGYKTPPAHPSGDRARHRRGLIA
jgi:hypothetical protein